MTAPGQEAWQAVGGSRAGKQGCGARSLSEDPCIQGGWGCARKAWAGAMQGARLAWVSDDGAQGRRPLKQELRAAHHHSAE